MPNANELPLLLSSSSPPLGPVHPPQGVWYNARRLTCTLTNSASTVCNINEPHLKMCRRTRVYMLCSIRREDTGRCWRKQTSLRDDFSQYSLSLTVPDKKVSSSCRSTANTVLMASDEHACS